MRSGLEHKYEMIRLSSKRGERCPATAANLVSLLTRSLTVSIGDAHMHVLPCTTRISNETFISLDAEGQ